MDKRKVFALSFAVVGFLSACGTHALPTQTPASPVPGSPSPSVAATVPDFATLGFPDALASQDIALGQPASVTGGAFTVEIPADAFGVPVRFEILTGPLADFEQKAPATVIPVLAFALRVTNLRTGELVGRFSKPVMLVASSPDIVPESLYYNITPDGTYVANPTGMEVKEDELRHPIDGATVGWVITVPEPAIE